MKMICGIHAATAVLTQRPQDIESVLLSVARRDQRLGKIEGLAQENSIDCTRVQPARLNRAARGIRHQGVIVFCRQEVMQEPELTVRQLIESSDQAPLIVILDGIEDPRNLGACLRSAEAAGAQAVILPRHRGSAVNETASRTAAGSAESLAIFQVSNLARTIDDLKAMGVWVIGLAADAPQSIVDMMLTDPCALVLGSEHAGLRRITREKCDHLAHIPIAGAAESYNVSVAVGIAAFEVARQRMAAS